MSENFYCSAVLRRFVRCLLSVRLVRFASLLLAPRTASTLEVFTMQRKDIYG